MRNQIQDVIKKASYKIQTQYHPDKIILFGSYAWGKPTSSSDIDLFIIKKTKARHIDRSVKIREILKEENMAHALDPIVYTPSEVKQRLKFGDDFVKKIMSKGVVLYA